MSPVGTSWAKRFLATVPCTPSSLTISLTISLAIAIVAASEHLDPLRSHSWLVCE